MRRTILLLGVAAIVLGLVPSAAAKKAEPIPTSCSSQWVANGWDVNGKNVNYYEIREEEDLVYHWGTTPIMQIGDTYCRGLGFLEGGWEASPISSVYCVFDEEGTPIDCTPGPESQGRLWGTMDFELSHFDGGFNVAYEGVPASDGVHIWTGSAEGPGYGELSGWRMELEVAASLVGRIELTGFVFPPRT